MGKVNLCHFYCYKCIALTESQQKVVSCVSKYLEQQDTEAEVSQSTLIPNSLNTYKPVPDTNKKKLKIRFRKEAHIHFYL